MSAHWAMPLVDAGPVNERFCASRSSVFSGGVSVSPSMHSLLSTHACGNVGYPAGYAESRRELGTGDVFPSRTLILSKSAFWPTTVTERAITNATRVSGFVIDWTLIYPPVFSKLLLPWEVCRACV